MIYHVLNLKCTGCAAQIRKRLSKILGIANINVDLTHNSISFTYDRIESLEQVKSTLSKMGYPLSDTKNTASNITKSYFNCMIGKVRNAI